MNCTYFLRLMEIAFRTGLIKRFILQLVLACCLSAFAGAAWAQNNKASVIKGNIRASDTGKPLEGVNVFLSKTNLGAATDRKGNYRIENIPEGIYHLVFSFVGFDTQVNNVSLLQADTLVYDASLNPEPIHLGEIQVTGQRNRQWEENLDFFEKEFIGSTSNSQKTNIINPEILNFKWNESGTTLSATTPNELHVINWALGYNIFVVLKEFKYTVRDNVRNLENLVQYFFYLRFENLQPENPSQKMIWQQKRKDTYLGSLKHFLYCLYHDRVYDEGFNIGKGRIEKLDRETQKYLLRYEPVSSHYKRSLKGYRFQNYSSEGPLTIEYKYRRRSYLLRTENNIFFVDKYGNLLKAKSLIVGGEWYRARLADELPLNYMLDE